MTMTDPKDAIFLDHIYKQARTYFSDFTSGQIRVQLLDKQKRPSAILYRFGLSDDDRSHSVIVKVPLQKLLNDQLNGSAYEKPFFSQRIEAKNLHWLQYTALTAIYDYFTSLNSKRLGAIRVLDYLPQHHAIFMEESSDPKLQQLMLRENRLRYRFNESDLPTAFENAGTWLRMYHKMAKKEDVQPRQHRREDYADAVTRLTDFLADKWGDRPFFKRTAVLLRHHGQDILPESLPLGLGHGDFAIRNILVGPDARVTVLDTLAKWRTPIYKDIGYFLAGLKLSYPQVVTQGLLYSPQQLRVYEEAFLKGYFGAIKVPYPAIRLYEVLALLDKWSSILMHYHRGSGKMKTFGRAKIMLTSRYFKKQTKSLLGEINKVKNGGTSMALERSY